MELDPAVRARLERLAVRLQLDGHAHAELYVEPDDLAMALAALETASQAQQAALDQMNSEWAEKYAEETAKLNGWLARCSEERDQYAAVVRAARPWYACNHDGHALGWACAACEQELGAAVAALPPES